MDIVFPIVTPNNVTGWYIVDFGPKFPYSRFHVVSGDKCSCRIAKCTAPARVRQYLKAGGQPVQPPAPRDRKIEAIALGLRQKREKWLKDIQDTEIGKWWREILIETPEQRQKWIGEHRIKYDYWG